MASPAVGQVIDGYRFAGGNPNDPNAWVKAGKADNVYAETLARERAKGDVKRLEEASAGERNAYGLESTALQARNLLNADTPTGLFADQRIAMSKTPLAGFLGIPSREQGANLETLRNIGNQGSLGQVGQLKGPLSEKELAFIQQMQVNPGSSKQYNLRVADAMKWAADRQAAYSAALQKWTENLGSPSAKNARGQSFDSWWGGYASKALPAPGTSRNLNDAALKQRSQKTRNGGVEILSVRDE